MRRVGDGKESFIRLIETLLVDRFDRNAMTTRTFSLSQLQIHLNLRPSCKSLRIDRFPCEVALEGSFFQCIMGSTNALQLYINAAYDFRRSRSRFVKKHFISGSFKQPLQKTDYFFGEL